MYYYPPPYYSGGQWYYVTPYLWADGTRAGYNYNLWRGAIEARMYADASVLITVSGTYNPTTRSGRITADFTNENPTPITGRIQFVIVEDSLYYLGPNNDPWHNHVARDFLPDWNGEVVTIPGGQTITRYRDYTLSTDWNPSRCEVVVFIQDDYMQPDSNKFVYQGAKKKINEFVAVEETPISKIQHTVYPNPLSDFAIFSSLMNKENPITITIYNSEGKVIKELAGKSSILWDRTDKKGKKVKNGIYFYRLQSEEETTIGKLVVIK
ncbi:MAG: Omp28-related outer membrane protein [candidate division WOR-3 bacterium]